MSSGKPTRVFRDFQYPHAQELEPDTSRGRQGRAHAGRVQSRRFVVTSLKRTRVAYDARALYEDLYCARGEAGGRIGEQFEMFADRASSATMPANQLRMSFSAMAYVLVDTLRRVGLRHSQFADASGPDHSPQAPQARRSGSHTACVAFISPLPPDAPTRLSSRSRTSIFGARLAPPESDLRSVSADHAAARTRARSEAHACRIAFAATGLALREPPMTLVRTHRRDRLQP